MTNMLETGLNMVNQAATASDRWWIAMLGFLICLGGRWLVKKHEKLLDEQRADQKSHGAEMAIITSRCNQTNETLSAVLARNTDAFNRNSEVLNEVEGTLRRKGAST